MGQTSTQRGPKRGIRQLSLSRHHQKFSNHMYCMKGGQKRKRGSGGNTKSVKRRKTSVKTKRRRAKAAASNQYLTDQHDKRVDYVAVKKPRKNVKKDIMFRQKVIDALQPTSPTVTKIKQVTETTAAITAGTGQGYLIFHMRPYNGSAVANIEPAQDDLLDISNELQSIKGAVADSELSGFYYLKSSIMTIDVEMTGTTDAVVDVYEIVYQKKAGDPTDSYASFNSMITAAASAGGMGTSLTMATRGVTPFDLTRLIRDFGAKVVKKTSNMITGGAGGFQYTVKDYRKQKFNGSSLVDNQFCVQGWTKTVLIVGYQLVSDGGGSTIRAYATKHYRIQPINNETTSYNWSGIN